MISFVIQGTAIKGILKLLSSCDQDAGVKASREEIVFWSTSPSRTFASEVRLNPDAVEAEYSGPNMKIEYSFSLKPAEAVSKVVKNRENVKVILGPAEVSLRGKGIWVKITPSTEIPPRPKIPEVCSLVKVAAEDFLSMLRISKEILGKEGVVRISLGPEGLFVTAKSPVSTVEMKRTPHDLSEASGERQMRENFPVVPLLEIMKTVPGRALTEIGISKEGFLVIKSFPGVVLGESYALVSPWEEAERSLRFVPQLLTGKIFKNHPPFCSRGEESGRRRVQF